MSGLQNAVRRIVAAMLAELPMPRRGVVTSVNPGAMRAKVNLPSVNSSTGFRESGWLPISSVCIGGGWGLVAAPPVGAQVMVVPMEGDGDAAVVMGGHWSNPQQPPAGYPVGELWLYHQSGAFVKVNNAGGIITQDQHGAKVALAGDGTIIAIDQAGSTLELLNDKTAKIIDGFGSMLALNGDGTAELKANLTVNGKFVVQNGTMTLQNGVVLDTHVHLVPAPVSGDTGVPIT